jgi:hypothetical protein
MDNDAFEKQMRSLEYFYTLRLLASTWVVIRLDGRGFSHFSKSRFDKPLLSGIGAYLLWGFGGAIQHPV